MACKKQESTMTHLIIPDIHNKFGIAEDIISKYPDADSIWFLGDYFDSFGDNQAIALDTAKWLKWSINQPNRNHLFGNHDLAYVGCAPCPGYTPEKGEQVRSIIHKNDWKKFKFYSWIDNTLLSHAGLSRDLHRIISELDIDELKLFLEEEDKRAWELIDQYCQWEHTFWQVGRERGGWNEVGGLTWCGFHSEFLPIKGINQIFGHTPDFQTSPNKTKIQLENNENYCIDGFLHHYATIEDGKIEIHENDWVYKYDSPFVINKDITSKWIKQLGI